MEHLLDIKEAAQVLNVSDMSIIHWTNSGKLNCYRVCGKRLLLCQYSIEDFSGATIMMAAE